MLYTENDLQNIIALCEQENENPNERLKNRCEKALVYHEQLRLTKKDKDYLISFYDEDMDVDAKKTLCKVHKTIEIMQSLDSIKNRYPKKMAGIQTTLDRKYRSNNYLKYHHIPMRRKPFKRSRWVFLDEFGMLYLKYKEKYYEQVSK